MALPILCVVRHGETAWSVTGQHTGRTDLALTERGEEQARHLRGRFSGREFARVFTSPLQRARKTCELAGFGALAELDADLLEWDYGAYEGRTSAEIRAERPQWDLFRDGCPGGEMPEDVAARADRVVRRARALAGDVLVFSSGHLLRMLAARWLGLAPTNARYLLLGTTGLSELSYEHARDEPAIRLWNDTSHLGR